MVGTLRELGADCDWLIPDRIADGYGLSAANVERLAERGTELLITVDCGITAVDEVALARELGMDVIVTDHHQPGEELPDCPILHPEINGYPFESLCGTAVAWKLACALRARMPSARAGPRSVALATVADVVPLVGENRSLVKRGLEEMRRAQRPGLRALIDGGEMRADAARRGGPGVPAGAADQRGRAALQGRCRGRAVSDRGRGAGGGDRGRAEPGELASGGRRSGRSTRRRRRRAGSSPTSCAKRRRWCVAGEGWHPGVVGIVASRLVERHHRPVVVISLDGEGGGRGRAAAFPVSTCSRGSRPAPST